MVEVMNVLVVVLCLAAGTIAVDEDVPVSSKFSRAATKFTVDLLKVLSEDNVYKNLVMSSTSLSTLLAIVQNGSEGRTQEELTKTLYTSPSESKEGYSRLSRNLKVRKGNSTLEFANGAFLNTGFEIEPAFKETVVESFQSSIETLKFANNVAAAGRINDWVAEHTHDRIQNLVSPGALSSDTRLVLANAIYFKDLWEIPFLEKATVDDTFYLSEDNTIQVPTMKMSGKSFRIGNTPEIAAKWVALPFQNDRFNMMVVYPDEVDGLSNLVQSLTGDILADIIESLDKTVVTKIDLSIPKFKLASSLNLVTPLVKLGIQEMFTDFAQLRGISKEPVSVSSILQKAEIEVDEKGATASAATAIGMRHTSIEKNKPLVSVIVDRPSLVFLLDMTNNLPLFTSRLYNPLSS